MCSLTPVKSASFRSAGPAVVAHPSQPSTPLEDWPNPVREPRMGMPTPTPSGARSRRRLGRDENPQRLLRAWLP